MLLKQDWHKKQAVKSHDGQILSILLPPKQCQLDV